MELKDNHIRAILIVIYYNDLLGSFLNMTPLELSGNKALLSS